MAGIYFKNIYTGEIKSAFKIGYSFMKDAHQMDPGSANPDNCDRETIRREGLAVVENDKEWQEICRSIGRS